MLAIWHQLDKSLKLFPSSSALLKQETVFRSGSEKKEHFFFRGKKNMFGVIRIIYREFFWAKKKIGRNQKKLKHFIATSSKWTVLFQIYADLTINRKVKQISEITLFIVLLNFYRKREWLCFWSTLNEDFVQLLIWLKPWKISYLHS